MDEGRSRTKSGLGGNDHVLAARSQRLAQYLLGLAFGINVGGVKEINAGVESLSDDLFSQSSVDFGDGCEESLARSEGHGAERHAGNYQSCIASILPAIARHRRDRRAARADLRIDYVADAVRQSVVRQHTQPMAQPLLNGKEQLVVVGSSAVIRRGDPREVLALRRILRIKYAPLIDI